MAAKANSAVIDIDYLTGQHHKLAGMSEIDRCRYLGLWGLALKLGRELLPEAYNGDDLTALREALGAKTNARRMADSLSMLCSRRLLVLPVLQSSKRIAVVGLKDRYPIRPIEVFDPVPWFGSVWIGSVRFVEQLQKTPAAPDVDNSKMEPKTTPSRQKTTAKAVNDSDVDDIRSDWSKRFPDGPELVHSLAQKVLNLCRAEWRDPRWLVGRVPVKAKDPVAYLIKLLDSRPFPSPPDGERAIWTWDQWQKRNGGPGVGESIGSILKGMAQAGT